MELFLQMDMLGSTPFAHAIFLDDVRRPLLGVLRGQRIAKVTFIAVQADVATDIELKRIASL